MRTRRLLAVLASCALAATSILATAPAHAAPSGTYSFDQLVNMAPAVRPLYVGYPGQQAFIPPAVAAKRDARGCNLRQRILISSATVAPKVGKKCSIVGGVWTSSISGTQIKGAKGVVMDLAMPMKAAWAQGASAWTPAQRLAWATAVRTGKSLRAKGVTPLPATNVVLSLKESNDARAAVARSNATGQSVLDIGIAQYCASVSMAPGLGCIFAGLINVYMLGAYRTDAQWDAYNDADTRCKTFGAYVGNIVQWGLSISPDVRNEFIATSAQCVNISYQFMGNASAQSIPAIQSPSVVPTLTTMPNSNVKAIVPPFTDYAAPATNPIPSPLFGMHAPVDWGNPGIPIGSVRLWDAGVSWREIEAEKGVYTWDTFDRSLAQAQNLSGTGALYVLGNAPKWTNGGASGATLPASAFDEAAGFAKKVCERSGGRIAMFEVWNEGNLSTYWAGTPQELAELTAKVRAAVHSCNAGIKVLASSTGVRAQQAFGTNYDAYLRALDGAGWPVDGYSVHSYPSASGGPQDRIANLAQFKSMLFANGAPVRPIYDTEMNYGLAGLGEGKVDVPQAKGAAWLSVSYIQTAQYGVDGLYWYVWSPAGDPTVGIQFTPGTPDMKTAWERTRTWLLGSRMQRCGNSGPLQMCQLTGPDGKNFSLLWLDSQPADPSSGLTTIKGLGTTVCPLLGSCTDVGGGEAVIQVGIEPIKVG